MKTCVVLNGHPTGNDPAYNQYVAGLCEMLQEKGIAVQAFDLHKMNIHYCTGCWVCWWTTPGRCVFQDDMESILRAIIQADQVLHISPLITGYISAMTKKAMDRMIPLVHPYIEVVQGEAHHRKRYAHYPSVALIVAPAPEDTAEDVAIARELVERLSLNMRSQCDYVHTTQEAITEVSNERCYA